MKTALEILLFAFGYPAAIVVIFRFVPVVRTFAPIAAGVGHMRYRKYSLYNLIGALIWGAGVTLIGYFLGYIPPVAHFVTEYIDLILVGAVLIAVVPAAYHYIHASLKARKNQNNAPAGDMSLDPSYFDQNKANDR